MPKLGEKLISLILKHPLLTILLVLLLTFGVSPTLPKIKIDNSVDAFFNKNNKTYIDLQKWQDQFGSDDVVVIAFSDKDIFTTENLRLIAELTEKFESIKYIDRVTSLSNVNDIIGSENDLIVEPLVKEIPTSPSELEALKKRVLSNPLFLKNVISSDGKTTGITLELKQEPVTSDIYRKEVVESASRILKETLPKGKKYYLSGFAAIEYFYALFMQKDFKLFLPVILFIVFAILLFRFRTFWGVVLPFIVVIISLIWTMAFLYYCGFSINNVTTVIPPIMIAYCIADSIHFIEECIYKNSQKVKSFPDIATYLIQRIRHLAVPCLLTSLTTAAGFFSLTISSIPPIRQLGLVVGVGVCLAFIVTFTFLPAMMKLFNILKHAPLIHQEQKSEGGKFEQNPVSNIKIENNLLKEKISRFLFNLAQFNARFKSYIIIATAAIVIFCLWGLMRIKTETSFVEYFKKDSSIYKSTIFIENNLSGIHLLNISLKADAVDYFKDPKALQKLELLQNTLNEIPEVDKTTSIVDYIKEMNKSFNNEDEDFYRIPDSKELVSQYMLLYGASDIDRFVDSTWQWTTLRIRLKEHSTTGLKKVIGEVNMYLDKLYSLPVQAESLGQTILEVEINDSVTKGQIQSLAMAMLVIFTMMFFVFRSFPVGLTSIIPNAIPILINFGIMGWVGVRLDSATSVISAIGIGIIVDNTIHYLHSFDEELKNTGDYTRAMYNSLAFKGIPFILTSTILFFGFGVVAISKFVPTYYFGVLSALLMVNALLADIVILPALLIYFKPRFKR